MCCCVRTLPAGRPSSHGDPSPGSSRDVGQAQPFPAYSSLPQAFPYSKDCRCCLCELHALRVELKGPLMTPPAPGRATSHPHCLHKSACPFSFQVVRTAFQDLHLLISSSKTQSLESSHAARVNVALPGVFCAVVSIRCFLVGNWFGDRLAEAWGKGWRGQEESQTAGVIMSPSWQCQCLLLFSFSSCWGCCAVHVSDSR